MKKGLLFLLAIFSIGIARAQVEVTDVSGMDFAMYGEELQATVGTEVELPICLKNATNITAFQGHIDLPEGISFVEVGTLNSERYGKGSPIFECKVNDGLLFFMGTTIAKTGFFPGDGVIGYIKIKIGADVEPGEYPITFVDYKLAGLFEYDAENDQKINEGVYPDQFGEGIVSKLIISDYVELFETATEAPAAMDDVNVVVNRTIKGGEWSTICLPFAMDANQIAEAFGSAEIADFASWTSESDDIYDVAGITLEFNSVDAMEANHPYIIKVGSDIESFRVDGVNIEPEEAPEYSVGRGKTKGTFYGTYTKTVVPEENLFLSGNKFWYSVGTTNMKGFRGYFELKDVLDAYYEEAPVKINLTVDGTTAISNIDLVKSNNEIFSVNGIKMGNDMNRLNKGIYIVNGKKIVK
ncbi:MAG: hypothetical protein IKN83_04405 [Bacteroidaceae bacterium]|nr:hypothetical protein [Bacteroidaceae bacterium]